MNIRRPIVHVLLSLLLVLSQLMAITHGVTHLSASRPGAVAASSGATPDTVPALDRGCEQCLAFAQIGAALDTGFYSFPVERVHAVAQAVVAPLAECQRHVCVFRSRAPPALS